VFSLDRAGLAGSAWDDIRPSAFGRAHHRGRRAFIAFQAPYRAEDQRTVPLSAEAAFKDGRKIKSITFIIDENPMPVAAAFRFADQRDRAPLSIDIRLDQPRRCASWSKPTTARST
jgi:sulfur-oxidizing protein SoxY